MTTAFSPARKAPSEKGAYPKEKELAQNGVKLI